MSLAPPPALADLYRSPAAGGPVEIWEANFREDGWTTYLIATVNGQDATILAEIRRRGDRFEHRPAGGPPDSCWLPFDAPPKVNVRAA